MTDDELLKLGKLLHQAMTYQGFKDEDMGGVAFYNPHTHTTIKKTDADITTVYTVLRIDDETTHIFSTQENAKSYADSLELPCVLSTYLVDEPNNYYEVKQ
jgi:hypothetical protein